MLPMDVPLCMNQSANPVIRAIRSSGQPYAVADLGFPPGGAPTAGGGVPTYDFAKISQKLHEIERIWTPGGGTHIQNFTV